MALDRNKSQLFAGGMLAGMAAILVIQFAFLSFLSNGKEKKAEAVIQEYNRVEDKGAFLEKVDWKTFARKSMVTVDLSRSYASDQCEDLAHQYAGQMYMSDYLRKVKPDQESLLQDVEIQILITQADLDGCK